MSENLFLGDTTYPHLPDVEQLQSRIAQLEAELAEARKDQARYQWIRSQNCNQSNLCVVVKPKLNVKLGAYCPSLDLLDKQIDAAIKEQQ
ncbi:hypothetical protein [Undibacterium baiyunense]|uniref:Uncharacterized protein n=1 Tax=Undibacterium baiyunense TaxID=2828731 RepID=A0A941DEL5_9BURK|nr:hypothetical protein [Undibacterium baiyunense]MBR7747418.1 hypothetical protein [Undibacterium baiyunense]